MDLIKTSKDSLDISDTEDTFFNLSVTIYEGRDFVWLDTPTQIIVKFGREKKHTAVHPPTKNPYFNEYFVFDFSGYFNQLLDIPLSIKVYSSKYGPVGKGLLASARFDLATIWLQPNHFISRKLVVLSHPNDPRGDIKGYVLCDLGITSPGVPLPLSTEPIGKPTTVQKGDYFAPDNLGGGKLKAKYCVNIYRAIGLNVSLEELIGDDDDDAEVAAPRKGKQKVRVYFAGMSGVTSNRYKRREPTWNEEIVFTEVFPPLYSRMRIDLYNERKTFCTRYINLFKISDSNIKGFLPTFGPSFLHMYCPVYDYFGSLLVGVTTQTLAALPEKKKLVGIKREPINPIEEHTYWTTDEFVAFAMVNSISSIDKSQSKQKLVFSMCLGDNERNPYDILTNHFLCRPQETVSTPGGHCCQIKDSDAKITFFIIKTLPDTRHRLFVSNSLDKLTSALAIEIERSYSFSEHDEVRATAILMSAVTEFLRTSSRIKSKELLAFTQLHKERVKVVKHNLGVVQDVFESREFRKAPIGLRLKIAAKHCKHIIRLIEDPQDNFPLLIFKAYAKNRKILAYCRFPLREVVFSPDDIESGKYCGVLQTLNLKHVHPSNEYFARMEVYLWFGLYRSVGYALQNLPPGFEDISNMLDLPRTITYKVHNVFTCRAHIHQGFFQPCDDSSEGLCSSSVKIFVGSQVGSSETLPKTTSPHWKSTIVIENVKLYGELSFLKEHVSPIAVEIHNQRGSHGGDSVVGRFFAIPFMYTSEEEISQRYPPSLMWYKVVNKWGNVGELLAMFELIHRGSVINGVNQPNLISVPELKDHVHPKTMKFRMEIMFWGIRDVSERGIVNPHVKIDFGNATFTSQVLQNLFEFPNFKEKSQFAEVEIPENILFLPPLIIRLYDGRSYGTSQYVGNCVLKNVGNLWLELVKKKEFDGVITPKRTRSSSTRISAVNVFNFQPEEDECIMAWPNVMITGHKHVEEEEEDQRVPLIKQLSKDGPRKPPSQDGETTRHPWLSRLKAVFKRKKVILQTTFDDEGNLITTAHLSDKIFKNDPDTNEKLFDWWTKYFEVMDKRHMKLQHLKMQASLAIEDEEVSVLKTAKELLKAFGKKGKKKELVSTSWKEFITALSMKCRIPSFSKSKSTTVGGKLELDAEALLTSIETDNWKTSKLAIFDEELEKVHSFGGFEDVVNKFPIRKQGSFKHKTSAFSQPLAYLKAGISFYKIDDEEYVTHFGGDASQGIYSPFTPLLSQEIRLMVRIYLIRGHKLNAKDESNLNPYLQVLTPSMTISDRGHIFLLEKSPVFALKFEIQVKLPFDSSITVRVMDWDKYSDDDLIGDTVIDIENRFFSRHRGSCGLAEFYNSEGYNQWRDVYKPSEILESLCESNNLSPPVYSGLKVVVAGKTFKGIFTDEDIKECAALAALRNWDQVPVVGCHLVPEHVETRSLYRPDAPGVEQGKIEMWVDILPELEEYPMPHSVDIKLRAPEEFELRLIAWQTKKVMKKDPSLFVMTRHVDIFLVAWMEGKRDRQKTDVHFASTSGHGVFNWRFIFNFSYYRAEKMVLMKSKLNEKPGKKRVPIVYLQVYDKERFRPDDPLGELEIDLRRIPRPEFHLLGTQFSVLNKVISPTIDIFTDRSLRGWFPFTQYTKKGKGPLKTVGYVDLEFNLLYKEEAIANPAGHGRNDPNPMPMPLRPKLKLTVVKILLAPFRKACFIMCKYHKGKMIKCLLIVGGTLFLVLFLINIPRNLSNRIFGPSMGRKP